MSEEPTWDDYLKTYLEPLKEKIDGLEETIKLIKEKMIKTNSDSIEKLEKKVEIHETFFEKQYNYDKSLIMERFKKLEKRIEKLEGRDAVYG